MHDCSLRRRAENFLPDALSRLPLRTDAERIEIADSFSDHPSSYSSTYYAGPRGPALNKVALTDIPSNISGHGNIFSIAALFSTVQPVPPVNTEIPHAVQQAFNPNTFLFAACAIIKPGAPNVLRRSHRRRTYSVCLWPLYSSKEKSTSPSHHPPLQNVFPAERETGTTDLYSFFHVGGRQDQVTPTFSSTHLGRTGVSDAGGPRSRARNARNVLDRALHALTDSTALREKQQHDHGFWTGTITSFERRTR